MVCLWDHKMNQQNTCQWELYLGITLLAATQSPDGASTSKTADLKDVIKENFKHSMDLQRIDDITNTWGNFAQ